MGIEMSKKDMEKIDEVEGQIHTFLEDILGIPLDFVEISERVKQIYDAIAEVGEQYGIPQEYTYPDVVSAPDFVMIYSRSWSEMNGGQPMFWDLWKEEYVSWDDVEVMRAGTTLKMGIPEDCTLVGMESGRKINENWLAHKEEMKHDNN